MFKLDMKHFKRRTTPNWMTDWSLTPNLAVSQLYHGVNIQQCYILNSSTRYIVSSTYYWGMFKLDMKHFKRRTTPMHPWSIQWTTRSFLFFIHVWLLHLLVVMKQARSLGKWCCQTAIDENQYQNLEFIVSI
jgi:hypothetical protein